MATTKKIGTIRVRTNQMKILVEAMEKNPLLNWSKLSSTYSASKRNEEWEELAKKLNNSGGAIKSVRCWQKCWTDKKGEVKKRNNLIKAERLKTGGIDEEKKLTALEERIILLIEQQDKAEGTNIEDSSEITHYEYPYVIPKVEVEDYPDSPTNGSSHAMASLLSNSQPFSQESNQTDSEEQVLPDTPSQLPHTEESHLPESLLPQDSTSLSRTPLVRLQPLILGDKTKPIVLKIDNAQKLELTEESNQTDSVAHLLPGTSSQQSHVEESHQTESLTPQFTSSESRSHHIKLRPLARKVRTKPVVLKSENAQKLVEGQIEMASALTRCAEALERHNEMQERILELKERKVYAQERILEIEKRKADAQERALEIEKRKVDAQERAFEIVKRKTDAQERALEIKRQKADAFVEILSTLKNKF